MSACTLPQSLQDDEADTIAALEAEQEEETNAQVNAAKSSVPETERSLEDSDMQASAADMSDLDVDDGSSQV